MNIKIILMGIIFVLMNRIDAKAVEYHKLDIGFHLSFLEKSLDYQKALLTIANDGFTHIAVYEPFAASIYKDQDRIVKIISELIGKKLFIQISLSNFPYEKATFNELWEKNRRKISLPEERAARVYAFSNRFPPADLQRYAQYLDDFVGKLERAKLMERVTFEIGSEPDSSLYFWGDVKDFANFFNETYRVLAKHKAPMLCCGLTSTFFTDPANKQLDFYEFIKSTDLIGKDVGFSFDIFFNTHKGYNDFHDISHAKFNNSVISSFGIFGKITDETLERQHQVNSSKFVNEFIKLLQFSYKNHINKVYLWRLMDNDSEKGRAGFFDMAGKPKASYRLLKEIHDVIGAGYYISSTDDHIEVIGVRKIIRLAVRDHDFFATGKRYSQSFDHEFKNRLRAGEWLIYAKP